MSLKCKSCGLEINTNICPFCGTNQESFTNKDFDDIFKEEKIEIDFNIKNILNDVDFRNEFENIKVQEANIENQYLECDLNDINIEKIVKINDYYVSSLDVYKKKQKKNLELFDIQMLQSHVASFNNIVDNCNKFKKMVPDKKIKKALDITINSYNKEIHYIKKYFILPLYDTPGLLNRSKIVKLLCDVASIFIIFFALMATKLSDKISGVVVWFTSNWGDTTDTQKIIATTYCIAVLMGIYLSEILFQIFLNITIKNKNFQVDKNKRYEVHAAIALVGLILACMKSYAFYGYVAVFFAYITFKTIKCILVDKWNIESLLEKAFIVILTFIFYCNFFVLLLTKLGDSFNMLSSILGFSASITIIIMLVFFGLTFFALAVNWQFYKKFGLEGWVSLVPFYNTAILYKTVFGKWTKMFLLFVPFYNIYFFFKSNISFAKYLKKGTGFGIGLTLCPIIFKPILAFSGLKKNKKLLAR